MRRFLTAALVALAPLAAPAAASAAGETTHAFMADRAIEFLPPGPLKTLLSAQRPMVMSGAAYPDSGYWAEQDNPAPGLEPRPTDDFGEVSHWERFIDAYVAHVRAKGCADLTDPLGPCAPLVAHLMGAAAHGLGDELWDWMFEPAMADHGEDPRKNFFAEGRPAHPLAGSALDEDSSSPEYAMDEVAIAYHARWVPPEQALPPVGDLVQVYADLGLHVTPEHILYGHAIGTAMMSAERAVAAEEGPRVAQDMPWAAAHLTTAPGGVDDVAHAIDGYYEALWAKLRSATHPAPVVSHRYPAPGAQDVPVRWLPARTDPGPRGGGASDRIVAVMSNAVDGASVTADAFRLLGPDGQDLPQLGGFPRPGPYGADGGTHTVMLYPASDLQPCTRYTVEVTRAVRDLQGASPPADDRWSFRTVGCGG